MSDITVGTPVTYKYGDLLVREGTYTGSGKRRWKRRRELPPRSVLDQEWVDKEFTGFIIGQRTLSNGDYTKGWSRMDYFGEWDGEPDQYQVEETFQAYLIVESLRGAPVKVRVEDVTIS